MHFGDFSAAKTPPLEQQNLPFWCTKNWCSWAFYSKNARNSTGAKWCFCPVCAVVPGHFSSCQLCSFAQ